MARITESQLVLPALYLMSKSGRGFMSTSELIARLATVMHPTGIDAQILPGRTDTYFSQKVRNLKSHDTLVRLNYAINSADGFQITPQGLAYVEAHKDTIDYLMNNEFNYEDVKTAIGNISSSGRTHVIPIEEMISEGRFTTRNIQTRERSSRLRTIAIEHFTHNNIISCDCCGFNFPAVYGQNYGKDCIEIHHIKPIFQYQDDSFEQFVEKHLKICFQFVPTAIVLFTKTILGVIILMNL